MKNQQKKGASTSAMEQLSQSSGQGHLAWTKPEGKNIITKYFDRLVVYYPETIAFNREKSLWTIEALPIDARTLSGTPEIMALNDLILAKSQRRELKSYDKYQEAMATYDRLMNLAGSGNYAVTRQSVIARDDFASAEYKPNQLVRVMFDTLSHETDNESIEFFEISIIYVDVANKVHAISIDKLILSDEQIKKIRSINYQAYSWYKRQHKLCTKNVCTREY